MATQTDCKDEPFLELTVEIQKLNEFKKTIEEKKSKSGKLSSVLIDILFSKTKMCISIVTVANDDNDLQFYRQRSETLESKLMVSECNEADLRKVINDYATRQNVLENRYKDITCRFEKVNLE